MSDNQIAIPIPVQMFLEVESYRQSRKWAADPVTIIQNVIENWLDTQEWADRTFPSGAGGYRWKHLLLQPGTKLRMRYHGTYHYAAIEGDRLTADNGASSPGQFVNTVSGTSRSAWRDLEIQRPGERDWTPASELKQIS